MGPGLRRDDGERESGVIQQCSRSEEFSEDIRAFLDKRKPVYIKR
jgi:hypothetical protein